MLKQQMGDPNSDSTKESHNSMVAKKIMCFNALVLKISVCLAVREITSACCLSVAC